MLSFYMFIAKYLLLMKPRRRGTKVRVESWRNRGEISHMRPRHEKKRRISYIIYHISYIIYHISYIIYHIPYTLCPIPYTLSPIPIPYPYTLYPIPYPYP